MTVIAFDGLTLAADRACDIGGIRFEVTKVRRFDLPAGRVLMAFAGDGTRVEQFVAWWQDGHDPECYPKREAGNDSVVVVIDFDRGEPRIRRYEGIGYPLVLDSKQFADGAGRDVALTAMRCGKDAREAVLLANEITGYCGLGVDTLSLFDK